MGQSDITRWQAISISMPPNHKVSKSEEPTHRHHIEKIDWIMAHTTCLVCLVSTVSDCHKNTLGRTSASNGHITKLEQSTFLRYLWANLSLFKHCFFGFSRSQSLDWDKESLKRLYSVCRGEGDRREQNLKFPGGSPIQVVTRPNVA